ncbi:MAG: helix-turn-helix domain-containing protein [Verrucomicrobiales bacterium]
MIDPSPENSAKTSALVPRRPLGAARRTRLTPEAQLEIVARVKNGESQSAIARELGLSRQRISAIMVKHAAEGDEGFVHKKRGRKKGPVPLDEIEPLIMMLRDREPAEFGFKKKDKWTYEKAEAAGIKVFGRKPPKSYLREAFKQAGVELTYDKDPDADLYTPEFKAYLRSAKAQEIREREAEYRRRMEEQGLVNKPRKIGRPTKEEAAKKAAQPWNFDVRESAGSSRPGDGGTLEPVGVNELEDIELPDWNNLSPEEMKEMQARYDMSAYLSGSRKPAPGTRVGKHRKGKVASKKKRKKKRR